MKRNKHIYFKTKYITIAKYLLIAFIMMRLGNVWMGAQIQNVSLVSAIQGSLEMNLLFILSMIDLLCVLELFRITAKLKANMMIQDHVCMLLIVCVIQIVLMNPMVSIALLVACYQLFQQLSITWKNIFGLWRKSEKQAILNINLLFLGCMCLFTYATMFSIAG